MDMIMRPEDYEDSSRATTLNEWERNVSIVLHFS